MENREIPGFYFDKAKNRYFKIQPGSAAAPPGGQAASYSADNVRKRRAGEQRAAEARKRREKLRHHIRRSRVLADPLTGGHLVREFGTLVDPELPVESWARGLHDKGGVCFPEEQQDGAGGGGDRGGQSISCLLVNGDDQATGMGVVYAPCDRYTLAGCYVPTDTNAHINYSCDPLRRRSRRAELHREPFRLDTITSLNYHAPSQQVFLTCTASETDVVTGAPLAQIVFFRPALSSDRGRDGGSYHPYEHEVGPHPAWLLGQSDSSQALVFTNESLTINAARLCPTGSSLVALLATSRGVCTLGDIEIPHNDWPPKRLGGPRGPDASASRGEVLTVDWPPTGGPVCYGGARDGVFFRLDPRAGDCQRDTSPGFHGFRHPSSVAHLRALDDGHQLLAAGPRSAMAVYDLRWMTQEVRRGAGGVPATASRPVVQMPGYSNAAHIHIGLDVARIAGAGQVVAAGMDDGSVGVFSLRTGRKLRAGALDDVDRLELRDSGGVVKALQWQAMPWDKDPSLWVAAGTSVRKFSFGLGEGEDGDY